MKELSLHILDIARNALNAGAETIRIHVLEDNAANLLEFKIEDDGMGMDQELLGKVNDPFFTTGGKKTGMGIPLLKQHAEAAGGEFRIQSDKGKGTRVYARFEHDHIDRQPMGDLVSTITGLIRCNPDVIWIFSYSNGKEEFKLDTRQIKEELKDVEITNRRVIEFIKDMINENLKELIE
jgi:hypothetical protein